MAEKNFIVWYLKLEEKDPEAKEPPKVIRIFLKKVRTFPFWSHSAFHLSVHFQHNRAANTIALMARTLSLSLINISTLVKCSRMRSSFSALSCALSTILFF
jgi:hypothetical protein